MSTETITPETPEEYAKKEQPVVKESQVTQTLTKTEGIPKEDSSIFGVSVRAWLAATLVATVCINHLAITVTTMLDAALRKDFSQVGTFTTVGEPLYSMSIAALGFYFGQKVNKP